jgi:Flp pilus assembly protein TadB
MGLAMGAHPVGFLIHSPAGRLVCCVGVLLDVGGVLWVRRIVRSAARA